MERITLKDITTQMVKDKMEELGLNGVGDVNHIVYHITSEALLEIPVRDIGVNPKCLSAIARRVELWNIDAERVRIK